MTSGVRVFLDGVKDRLAKATPGPWTLARHALGLALYSDAPGVGLLLDCDDGAVPVIESDADAEFIAAAPSDVSALIAAVEAVLALHKQPAGSIQRCQHCAELWPCPTVRAVAAQLDPGKTTDA